MRLVDHQHAGGRGQPGQHPVPEVGVVQPLRADQQQVHLAGLDRGVGALPVRGVGRVDGDRADAGPLRGVDLVAHQRQQRRDDHRRAGPGRPQQRGGHEVDRRLAPAGALHDQRPGAPLAPARAMAVHWSGRSRAPGPASSASTASARSRSARGLPRAGQMLGSGHGPHGGPAPRQFRPHPRVVHKLAPAARPFGGQGRMPG